jgi:hypothetical protein
MKQETILEHESLIRNIDASLALLCESEKIDAICIDDAGRKHIKHAHHNGIEFRHREEMICPVRSTRVQATLQLCYWNVYLQVGASSTKVSRMVDERSVKP